MLPLWGENSGGPYINKGAWLGSNKVLFIKHGSRVGWICPLRLSFSDLWWKTRPLEKYCDLHRCGCWQRCTPLAMPFETLPVSSNERRRWSLRSSIFSGVVTSQCALWCFAFSDTIQGIMEHVFFPTMFRSRTGDNQGKQARASGLTLFESYVMILRWTLTLWARHVSETSWFIPKGNSTVWREGLLFSPRDLLTGLINSPDKESYTLLPAASIQQCSALGKEWSPSCPLLLLAFFRGHFHHLWNVLSSAVWRWRYKHTSAF